MSRRMSCSLTVEAVRSRAKTVTRRHIDTWQTLRPGDRLTLVEKAMGLPRGAKQVVLAEVEIVGVEVWPLEGINLAGELAREGFPHMAPDDFVAMWAESHGYGRGRLSCGALRLELLDVPVRRIEWRYVEEQP